MSEKAKGKMKVQVGSDNEDDTNPDAGARTEILSDEDSFEKDWAERDDNRAGPSRQRKSLLDLT